MDAQRRTAQFFVTQDVFYASCVRDWCITKICMMLPSEQKPFGLHGFYKNISTLTARGSTLVFRI